LSKIRLFIVDDELDSRELLAYFLLEKKELEIIGYYADGSELANEIKKHKPDVVFTDISMPSMSGVEAAKQLQKVFPGLRFVFVTAHSHFREIAKTVNNSEFLLKPVDPEELDICVENIKAEYAKSGD